MLAITLAALLGPPRLDRLQVRAVPLGAGQRLWGMRKAPALSAQDLVRT
jgi:hypothetical protein